MKNLFEMTPEEREALLAAEKLDYSPTPRISRGASGSWGEDELPTSPVLAKPVARVTTKPRSPAVVPEVPSVGPKPLPIPEVALKKLEETRPDLVARYRERMGKADAEVQAAERNQEIGNYGSIAANIANDFSNSQKDDVIYKNSWSKMGNAPQIERAEAKKFDSSAIDKIGQQGVDRAKSSRQQAESDFFTGEKLSDLQEERTDRQRSREELARLKDPNSAESKAARASLVELAPKFATGKDLSLLSAAQIEKIAPQAFQASQQMLNQEFTANENKKNRDHQRELSQVKAETKSAGTKEGIKALDKDYAKDYNDYTSKGRVNGVASINKLKAIQQQLEGESKSVFQAGGGPISGALPDWTRTQQSISLRDNARNAANATLKSLFGGQLSDGERKAAASEFYNDSLDAAANAKLLKEKIEQMELGLAEEDAKASHFQKYKTLENYQSNQSAQTEGFGNWDFQAEDARRSKK